MGAMKYWDGAQWVTVRRLPGPQGPQGLQAVDLSPAGAAGGALSGGYPNPKVKRESAGTLLALQIDRAAETGWVVLPAGTSMFMKSGATPLAISYTPEVPCWWDVTAVAGGIAKDDAAYHYSYGTLVISPADADGIDNRNVIFTQHNGVTPNAHRIVKTLFKLDAGVGYSLRYWHSPSAGTWEYYQASLTLYMIGKVWAR